MRPCYIAIRNSTASAEQGKAIMIEVAGLPDSAMIFSGAMSDPRLSAELMRLVLRFFGPDVVRQMAGIGTPAITATNNVQPPLTL
jgi:hypothetical protein